VPREGSVYNKKPPRFNGRAFHEILIQPEALLVGIRVDALGPFKGVAGAENLFKFLSLGVEVDPVLHLFREIGIRIDGLDRTFVDTGIAVDACVRVDIKSVGRLMESVNRTDSHTGGEFAVNTRFSYNVSHGVFIFGLLE
jgi:hypothetical protein